MSNAHAEPIQCCTTCGKTGHGYFKCQETCMWCKQSHHRTPCPFVPYLYADTQGPLVRRAVTQNASEMERDRQAELMAEELGLGRLESALQLGKMQRKWEAKLPKEVKDALPSITVNAGPATPLTLADFAPPASKPFSLTERPKKEAKGVKGAGAALVLLNMKWKEAFSPDREPTNPVGTLKFFSRQMNRQASGDVEMPDGGYLHRALEHFGVAVPATIKMGPVAVDEYAALKAMEEELPQV